jgi:hypothetical protein
MLLFSTLYRTERGLPTLAMAIHWLYTAPKGFSFEYGRSSNPLWPTIVDNR